MGTEAHAGCEKMISIVKERVEHLRNLTTGIDPASLALGPPDCIRRDHANYLLARRTVTFGTASLRLFDPDFVAPMAATVRSMLETTFVHRWVLGDPAIAEKWFRKGDAQIREEGQRLMEAHAAAGVSFDEDFRAFIEGVQTGSEWNGLPFNKFAKGQMYLIYYPKLSGWAHPSAAGMWSGLDPDHDYYDDLVVITSALAIAAMDAVALYEAWVKDRSVADPPAPLQS